MAINNEEVSVRMWQQQHHGSVQWSGLGSVVWPAGRPAEYLMNHRGRGVGGHFWVATSHWQLDMT